MGIITIEKANNLFWLGRYIERVYTSTLHYMDIFDDMLDKDPMLYITYCKQLDIPDVYLNEAHFMMSYLYDMNNPDSIASNLKRAYDNAIVLREEITTKVLSYIQMGVNSFETMNESEAPILSLQTIIDLILAFKGAIEEYIDDPVSLDIIKLGGYVERSDLYSRLGYPQDKIDLIKEKLNIVSKNLCNETSLLSEIDLTSDLPELIYSINNSFNY